MYFHPDQLHHIVSDRQRELRSEAATQRLAGIGSRRTRVALALRRAADRFDAATSPCAHVRRALAQRG